MSTSLLFPKFPGAFRNILASIIPLGAMIGTSHAAVVAYTYEAFTTTASVSAKGTLVQAVNLGSANAVTMNTVTFAEDNIQFFTNNGTNSANSTYYRGPTITGLTVDQTSWLLDYNEYAPSNNNSLARFSGLSIGQDYEFQLIIVDDRTGPRLTSFGYAEVSGGAKVYPLTGVNIGGTASVPEAKIVTGTFTANETAQDIHIAVGGPANGQIAAFQLRSVPEPTAALLGGMGFLILLRRRR